MLICRLQIYLNRYLQKGEQPSYVSDSCVVWEATDFQKKDQVRIAYLLHTVMAGVMLMCIACAAVQRVLMAMLCVMIVLFIQSW